MTISIETERLFLRELRIEDATEVYLGWFKDATATRYICTAVVTKELTDLRRYVLERAGREDVLFLGIFEKVSGLHIGNIKYEPVDTVAGFAIMGILIGDPAYRGMGVTPEVLKVSAAWLKAHRGIRQIVLRVLAEHTAAVRAYERVGFVVEDTPHIATPYPGSMTMVWHL